MIDVDSHGNGNDKDIVILLHGLGRRSSAMVPLKNYLNRRGFQTINCAYPSRRYSIAELAERFVANAYELALHQVQSDQGRVHFVTHSLGGILVRYWMSLMGNEFNGRMVMLSPPNQGSEVAQYLKRIALFRRVMGPTLAQLSLDNDSVPVRLPNPTNEVGVITGSKSGDPWFNRFFEGSHDGKVSVKRAQLEGMKDFMIVPCNHTLIMFDARVMQASYRFLRFGRFSGAGVSTIEGGCNAF